MCLYNLLGVGCHPLHTLAGLMGTCARVHRRCRCACSSKIHGYSKHPRTHHKNCYPSNRTEHNIFYMRLYLRLFFFYLSVKSREFLERAAVVSFNDLSTSNWIERNATRLLQLVRNTTAKGKHRRQDKLNQLDMLMLTSNERRRKDMHTTRTHNF